MILMNEMVVTKNRRSGDAENKGSVVGKLPLLRLGNLQAQPSDHLCPEVRSAAHVPSRAGKDLHTLSKDTCEHPEDLYHDWKSPYLLSPASFYPTSPLPGPFVINPRLHRRSPAPSAFACLNFQLHKSC